MSEDLTMIMADLVVAPLTKLDPELVDMLPETEASAVVVLTAEQLTALMALGDIEMVVL